MTKTVAETLYDAYPNSDLLPIDPPRPGETIGDFAVRAEHAGDTLFLFLCREACDGDEVDAAEYLNRLERAIGDIEAVRDAFQAAEYLNRLECAIGGVGEAVRDAIQDAS